MVHTYFSSINLNESKEDNSYKYQNVTHLFEGDVLLSVLTAGMLHITEVYGQLAQLVVQCLVCALRLLQLWDSANI